MAKKSGKLNNVLAVLIKKKQKAGEKLSINTRSSMKALHYHDYYEIVIAKSIDNDRIFIAEDKTYNFNPNYCVNMSPPGCRHIANGVMLKYRMIIDFTEDFGREIFEFLGVDMDELFAKNVCMYSKAQIDKLIEIGESLHKECVALSEQADAVKNSPKIRALFALFAGILTEYTAVCEPVPTENSILRIKRYLENNYRRTMNLDEIAGVFYMNKFTMSRKFKEETGTAIIEYVTQLRLEEAKKLLVQTRFSVEEVAKKVGYNSGKYFGKIFAKYEKISPDAYRKKERVKNERRKIY